MHSKHMNALCGQNLEFLSDKYCGVLRNHWALSVNVLSFCPLRDSIPIPLEQK